MEFSLKNEKLLYLSVFIWRCERAI